jgi:hypothetical protein
MQERCLAYLTISCRLQGDLDQAHAYAQQGLEAATAEQNPLARLLLPIPVAGPLAAARDPVSSGQRGRGD